MSWSLAWSLFDGFRSEFGTHTHAALSGWNYPASFADVIAALHYRDFLRVNVDEKDQGTISVPLPWDAANEQFSAEEVAEVAEFLGSVSAIPD